MKAIEQRAFRDMDEFREFAARFPVLYFHVFEGSPDDQTIAAFKKCGDDEALVLLDVADDLGFLDQTQVTVEVTRDHQFVSKPLRLLRGVGAWAKGTLVDFAQDTAGIAGMIQLAQRFSFLPPKRQE
ncbi:MAG: hypothetical protein JNM56_28360 [Planctomycetia bacterium]|nr:hypothetical protein [Planctomycetia bacterium]